MCAFKISDVQILFKFLEKHISSFKVVWSTSRLFWVHIIPANICNTTKKASVKKAFGEKASYY